MKHERFGVDEEYKVPPDTVQNLHERGWAALPGLLNRELVEEIRRRLSESEGIVQPTESEKWMTSDAYKKVVRSHDAMAWKDDWFRAIGTSKRMTSVALQLLSCDEALFIHDMSFLKPGEDGGATPFHQDFPFWPLDRKGALTIWIALMDMSPEMGTLQFLAGSQAEGPVGRFSRAPGDDVRGAYPWLSDKYSIEGGGALAAGDATVHLDLTLHGAGENRTGEERAAYVLRYMPTDVLYTGAPHRHFDSFGLTVGEPFAASPHIPHVELT